LHARREDRIGHVALVGDGAAASFEENDSSPEAVRRGATRGFFLRLERAARAEGDQPEARAHHLADALRTPAVGAGQLEHHAQEQRIALALGKRLIDAFARSGRERTSRSRGDTSSPASGSLTLSESLSSLLQGLRARQRAPSCVVRRALLASLGGASAEPSECLDWCGSLGALVGAE